MATIVASPPTSAEPDVLLFDLAAGDGEDAVDDVAGSMVLEAGPRFLIPLLGPGRRGGGMVKTVEPPLRPGRVPGSNMLKTLAEDLEIGELLDHDGQVACLLTVTTYNATWSLLVDDIRAKLLTASKPRHTYKQTQIVHLIADKG